MKIWLWYRFDTKKWREQKCSVEILQHRTLKPLYSEYKKSRDKEKYLRWREREIILFEASGVGDKLPDLAKLREEDSRLSEEKD